MAQVYTLANSQLQIKIADKGAELQSIVGTAHQLEYMWQALPAWPKHSPVLFPIVGGLKNGSYQHNGNTYKLPRHGFARDRVFECTSQQSNTIVFTLRDDEDSRHVYPFAFEFLVSYTLQHNKIIVGYKVNNPGNGDLYFSVGAHPAFKVPLAAGTAYEDYYLHFNHNETAGRWPLSPEGLIEKEAIPLIQATDVLPLSRELFAADAVVLKHLQSNAISIRSNASPHGVKVLFEDFPYMGIWAAKGGDFVCIEPWCGIADNVDATGELKEKEGINCLEPGGIFERHWTIEVF